MNQIELVIANLIDRIAQTEKENAVLKANLVVAQSRIEELENPKESENNG